MAWIRAPNQVVRWETKALEMGVGTWECPKVGWDKWRWARWVLQKRMIGRDES